ncbi:OmpP1/FadL family transporter [Inmirania thermothiophila]|uniref:Long-chain fatty acid transport protein n=1 Tax=Inmirania thermothiophila TaxID=1750597 RepID=A0A3N1XXA8_9GAMM|nr:OmpP1/FadL family transporter [Inmirania thermothiophila]ROR29842.1 long-chain fatty acid transport protein [Inmirania thermothiophila]
MNHRPLSAAILAGALAAGAGSAQGAGFAIIEQSVPGLGAAFAGAAAAADDPSTVFFNPAGMTKLEGRRLSVGVHIIEPTAEFSGSATTTPLPGGAPIPGGDGGDGGSTGVVPNFYYVTPIGEGWRFGLGINAPFGLKTEYDDGWVGRYHAIESEVRTVNINPSLAFRAGDDLSVGFGVSALWIDATLSDVVDMAGVCFGLEAKGLLTGGVPVPPGTVCTGSLGFGLADIGSGAHDGKVEVDGDDWGYGWNVGLLWQPGEGTRIGFAYRSKISVDISGDADFTLTDASSQALAAATGAFKDTGAKASIDLPETLSVSVAREVAPGWEVLGDVTWTRWSRFDELVIEFDNPVQNDSVQPENWKNSYRVALGAVHRVNARWAYRFGIAYDQTPIPSAEARTPRIPGNDRRWVALGASFTPSERLAVHLAYAHLFVSDPPIAATEVSTGHVLTGSFDASVDIVSAQVNWLF